MLRIERVGKFVALDFAADVDQRSEVALLQALQLGVVQLYRSDDLGKHGQEQTERHYEASHDTEFHPENLLRPTGQICAPDYL